MSLLTSTTGKRLLLANVQEGVGENDEGQQQLRKVQKLMTNSDNNSSNQNKSTDVSSTKSGIPVNVKAKIPDDIPLLDTYRGGEFFFVRECYAEYYLKVEALLVERKAEYVTVTGTPGIGKSLFYAFFADLFRKTHDDWTIVTSDFNMNSLSRKLTVFGPGKLHEVHRFPSGTDQINIILRLHGDEVETANSKSLEKKILWLCDGPPKREIHDIGQMVVFASPTDRLRHSWRYRHTYYLPPWTLEELQLAASVLDYPFSDDEIENRFWKFGGVARNCFMLDPGRLPCELGELTKPTEVITCREALNKLLVGVPMDDRHHYFLHYEPKGDGRQWDTKLVSAMVREKLAMRLFSVIKGRMNQTQDLLLGIPDAESLRRSILEVRVHTKLQRGRPLIARRLDVATERGTRFKIVESAEMDIFQSNELTTALLNNGPYHKLKQNNYLSVDGFYFPVLPVGETPSLNEKDKRILLFRMADSTTIPVRASGIIYLLKKLGLLDMVKANPKHATLIFFHPAVGLKDFNRQQILSNGVCPERVDEVEGIGSGTLKTLRTYNVKTIADLEEKIDDFQNGNMKKDRENWSRAVRLWEQEVQCLDDPANVKMVDEIPQYVASSG